MENREITFLSHYRYVINNEDKTKVMLSIISKKEKCPVRLFSLTGFFSAKNVKHFFKKI